MCGVHDTADKTFTDDVTFAQRNANVLAEAIEAIRPKRERREQERERERPDGITIAILPT